MNKKTRLFVIFSIINVLVAFWLSYFGFIEWINTIDFTYISFFIMFLYLMGSASLYQSKTYDIQMFLSNNLTSLGLLGTVIGLMVAVNAMSGLTISPDDQSSIVQLMQKMFNALGTSLITTIVGLIASLMLKYQIVCYDMVSDHETE